MGRIEHILKKSGGSFIPQQMIFLDTETESVKIDDKTEECIFKLGVLIYKRKYKSRGKEYETRIIKDVWSLDELWGFINDKIPPKTTLWLFAHNFGKFDFSVIKGFSYLHKQGWELEFKVLDCPPFILKFRKQNRSLIFVDTMNYFPVSLKELGKIVSLEKLDMASNNLLTYCQRDAEILEKVICKLFEFIKQNDLGSFKYTAAGLALEAFRHKFLNQSIYIHNNKEVLQLERQAYFGGRTEAFRLGKFSGNFYLLDINSLYPYVMLNYEYPIRLVYFGKGFNLESVMDRYCVIADVDLETDINFYPKRLNGKLIFPIGRFRTVLNTEEIKFALENNHIKNIHFVACYEKKFVFSDYVNYFYSLRQKYKLEGNKVFEFFTKLLMNSLYGKFGQKGDGWEKVGNIKDDETYSQWFEIYPDGETKKFRRICNTVFEYKAGEEGFNSFPAIAAHTTSYARLVMWKLLNKAGKENVFYMDTDSLLVNQSGYEKLKDNIGNNIGQLKIEKQANYIEIRNVKDYTIDNLSKIKGIRKDAIEVRKNEYLQKHFVSIRGLLHKNLIDRQLIIYQMRKLRRQYEKGRILDNGEIEPIYLCEF